MDYFKIGEFNFPETKVKNKIYPFIEADGKMNLEFLTMLDTARKLAKIPFKINSGYRPNEFDTEVHKIPDSDHSKGVGADIACETSGQRYKILWALIKAGFTRIGIADTHIHVGGHNETKPSVVIWIE